MSEGSGERGQGGCARGGEEEGGGDKQCSGPLHSTASPHPPQQQNSASSSHGMAKKQVSSTYSLSSSLSSSSVVSSSSSHFSPPQSTGGRDSGEELPVAFPVQAPSKLPQSPRSFSCTVQNSSKVVHPSAEGVVSSLPAVKPLGEMTRDKPTKTQEAQIPSQASAAAVKPFVLAYQQGEKGPFPIHGLKQPPQRPGFGTKGRKMMVVSNFFPLRLPNRMTVYHYDVAMSPEKISKNHSRMIFEEFSANYLNGVVGAFDGSKNCYFARRPFQDKSLRGQVRVYLDRKDEPKEVTVTLKPASIFDVDCHHIQDILSNASEAMPMIQALDVVLRHLPSLRMEPIGRSFFTKPDHPFLIGSGREVWNGYYQSVRPTMGWKVMLNVDKAATAFYSEQSVFDFMCMTLRRCHPADSSKPLTDYDRQKFMGRELTDSERRTFSREIKGLKIVVSHLPYPRKYKVVDLTRHSARKQTFPLSDGSVCSVEKYFKENYPDTSKITNPLLPCLHVGQPNRHVYLPMDVCKIVGGQRCMKMLNDIQTANMIRHTSAPATERKKTIEETVRKAGFNDDPIAREFGISVSSKMVEIPSRVLKPPTLRYNRSVTPGEGKGCWDMRGAKFYEGTQVSNWVVLVCANRCNCERFISELMKTSDSMGMKMKRPLEVTFLGRQSVEKAFFQLLSRYKNLDLILAIIDKRDSHYDEVKRLGDTKSGMAITTQCVLSTTVEQKCNHSTLSNICLKINARLGGVNNIVEMGSYEVLRQCPVIIFGADVTHPRSGDTTSPSIASVVASVDLHGSRYRALHFNQKNRQEIIANLKEMAKEHLKEFRAATGWKPQKIIFYRDGVSEGQFNAVRQEEISALQKACLDLQKNGSYQPKITFIVVQKRHHTRFFPKDQADAVGKGRNVPPGTTVDSIITHHTEHDFYLCSHSAIQGTSRPCHYHVLWDDSDFSADALQGLSYQLCHMFWRCNRSVSYPAPTYYAHRDAAHARMLLQASGDSSSSGGGKAEQRMTRRAMDDAIEIHKDRKGEMYFL